MTLSEHQVQSDFQGGPTCPGCGHTRSTERFHRNQSDCIWDDRVDMEFYVEGKHTHRVCLACSGDWVEKMP